MPKEIDKYKISIEEVFELNYLEKMFEISETFEGVQIKQKLIANLGKKIFDSRVAVDKVVDREKNKVTYSTSVYVFNENQLKDFIDTTLRNEIKNEVDKRIYELKRKLENNNA